MITMKKRLLLWLFASTVAVGVSAADYVFTKDARYKLTGSNLMPTAESAWGNEAGGGLASNWSWAAGAGPNGENALQSNESSSEAGTMAVNSVKLDAGIYVVSYQAKAEVALTTTVASTTANYIAFYTNADGAATTVGRTISEVANIGTEWTTVNDTVQVVPEDGEYLFFAAKQLPAGTQIANVSVFKATAVYDVRIIEREVAWAKKLMADTNFNIDGNLDVADALLGLNDIIDAIKRSIEDSGLEKIDEGTSYESELKLALDAYLDVTTEDIALNKYFQYVEDLTAFPKYNRGQITDGLVIGGFKFYGENWLHGSSAEYLNKQIQGTYANGTGSVVLFNDKMPAGKYFIAAEMRNAYCDGSYNYTYNLESPVKGILGTNTVELGTIVGEEFTRYYFITELKEGETFEGGFFWDNAATAGSAFNIYKFQVRSFEEVGDYVAHVEAWRTFKTQYDAATSARKKLLELKADANYPWKNDSLDRALIQWDPYYDAVASWIDADGNDTGVATTAELNEWAKYQGVELYSTPEDDSEPVRLEYQVVRGYQNANNLVINAAAPLTNLAADIKAAEGVRDDDMNVQGDKETFQAAIDAAMAVLNEVLANTNDTKYEADVERIEAAREALAAAVEAFKASAVLTPIVDIDFSQGFTAVKDPESDTTDHYEIAGVSGKMEFPATSVEVGTDGGYLNTGTTFGLGYGTGEDLVLGDVLRVGNATATVNLTETFTDDDVVRVEFDIWVGNLNKKNYTIELQNAAGERIAGFQQSRYDGTVGYNDFSSDQAGAPAGLDINKYVSGLGSSIVSNKGICEDANKSSFTLIVDYKAQAVQGIVVNGKNGTCSGEKISFADIASKPGALADNKVAKFVLSSNYNVDARRCWFDNLKIYKYASQATEVVPSGIRAVESVAAPQTGVVYNLRGMRVANPTEKGIYIRDGKKFVVK